MQLWQAPTSPFARKVRIAARELGLAAETALVATDPWTDNRLCALDALAKVRLEDDRSLARLEGIGEIAVGAFLTCLRFRWPERAWLAESPELDRRLGIERRPSLRTTGYRLSVRQRG